MLTEDEELRLRVIKEVVTDSTFLRPLPVLSADIAWLIEKVDKLNSLLRNDPCNCEHEEVAVVDNIQGGKSTICANCDSELFGSPQ